MTKRVRTLTLNDLETPTRRLKLAQRIKPYWYTVSRGVSIGYRAGPGSWVVRCANGKGGNWVRKLGDADDREAANGDTVLSYTQALDAARDKARETTGGDSDDAHSGQRIVTVAEAIADYKADLIARKQNPANAGQARYHLPSGLLAKPVPALNARELKAWRNGMSARGDKATSINRRCRALKAALNLAAREDNRITNGTAWRFGLTGLPEDGEDLAEDNTLNEQQCAAVVGEAEAISEHLGIFIELHVATGARSSQIRLIKVRDLELGREGPLLKVPSSLKGKRAVRRMIPLPISADLFARLKVYAAGRKPTDALTRHPTGRDWKKEDNPRDAARKVFAAAGLDPTAITLYSLRHTAITRLLLDNVPIRLVAATFDTSVAMIEKTYSRFIVHRGDAQLRAALVGDAIGGNVVALRS